MEPLIHPDLWGELEQLNKLHQEANEDTNSISRLFALKPADRPMRTWEEVEAAKTKLEQRLPGYYLHHVNGGYAILLEKQA